MITAVVLAGGLGTRLREAVADVPKPMAPINGRPFLEYQLDYWIGQGVGTFILSVGFMSEKIESHFGSSYKGAAVKYSIEDSPLDTGGALLLAAHKLESGSNFLLLNGDTFFKVSLDRLIQFADASRADWCLSLFRSREKGRYTEIRVSDDGEIQSFRAEESVRPLANGGVYLVNPESLAKLGFSTGDKVSLERQMFPAARAAGQRVYGIEFSGDFLDIGVPDDYYRAARIVGA